MLPSLHPPPDFLTPQTEAQSPLNSTCPSLPAPPHPAWLHSVSMASAGLYSWDQVVQGLLCPGLSPWAWCLQGLAVLQASSRMSFCVSLTGTPLYGETTFGVSIICGWTLRPLTTWLLRSMLREPGYANVFEILLSVLLDRYLEVGLVKSRVVARLLNCFEEAACSSPQDVPFSIPANQHRCPLFSTRLALVQTMFQNLARTLAGRVSAHVLLGAQGLSVLPHSGS